MDRFMLVLDGRLRSCAVIEKEGDTRTLFYRGVPVARITGNSFSVLPGADSVSQSSKKYINGFRKKYSGKQ